MNLSDKIVLKWKGSTWKVQLDYENMTFRCKTCQQNGHLQDTCPLAQSVSQSKKGNKSKNKRWDALMNPQVGDLEQEEDIDDHNSEPKKRKTQVSTK